jgi:hypothetical protein
MMLKTSKIVVAVFCAVLLWPLTVDAATVSNEGGSVLVSKGKGFSPIASHAEVAPGSQVLVRPGGLAVITYADNCAVRVGSGVWLVQDAPPCADGATLIDFTGRMNQQAEPPPLPGIDPAVVVGGVIVAGAIGLAVVLSQNQNDRPASP